MSKQQILNKLIEDFAVLQQSARCAQDITVWLISNAELLRSASKALGHQAKKRGMDIYGNTSVDPYADPAALRYLMISGLDSVYIKSRYEAGVNAAFYNWHVPIRVTATADSTINLGLLFHTIPELGLIMEKPVVQSANGTQWTNYDMVIDIKRWPIAASVMLMHFPHADDVPDTVLTKRLLAERFPATPWGAFVGLHGANLFDTPGELCDLLMENERLQQVSSPDSGADLPRDFQ